MAWGYNASFTVEHDNTLKRTIDCKDCIYYDSSDKSCTKTPRYLPEDGFNSWRKCGFFELDSSVSHYDEKREQFNKWSAHTVRKEIEEHKTIFSKKASKDVTLADVKANKKTIKSKEKNKVNIISDYECKNLILKEYVNKSEIPDGAIQKILYIYLDNGEKKGIQLEVASGYAFVKGNSYPTEYLMETKRIFKKK